MFRHICLKLFLGIVMFVIFTAAQTWPCPLANDISPCTCKKDATFAMDVDCSTVTSDSDLELAFTPDTPFYDYRQLNIIKDGSATGNLNELSFATFHRVSFQEVDIQGSTLSKVSDGTFTNSEKTLTTLKLSHNNISLFEFEVLPKFKVLELLDLSYNSIKTINKIDSASLKHLDLSFNYGPPTIDDQTFSGCLMLEYLDLSATGLTEVPVNAFSNNPLSELRLSGNQLSILKTNAINTTGDGLMQLSLNDNSIELIEKGSIFNLNNKGRLDMRNNNIVELTMDDWIYIFTTLEDDQSIDLSGNGLNCGCSMKWLFTDEPPLVNKLTDSTLCSDLTQTNTIPPDVMIALCP